MSFSRIFSFKAVLCLDLFNPKFCNLISLTKANLHSQTKFEEKYLFTNKRKRVGVNFTNILRAAFTCGDPKSAKRQSTQAAFCTFGIFERKSCREHIDEIDPRREKRGQNFVVRIKFWQKITFQMKKITLFFGGCRRSWMRLSNVKGKKMGLKKMCFDFFFSRFCLATWDLKENLTSWLQMKIIYSNSTISNSTF